MRVIASPAELSPSSFMNDSLTIQEGYTDIPLAVVFGVLILLLLVLRVGRMERTRR